MKTNKFIKFMKSFGFVEINSNRRGPHRRFGNPTDKSKGQFQLSRSQHTKEVSKGHVKEFRKLVGDY